jgi:hypothetical protein
LLFSKMDLDGNGDIDMSEAKAFWSKGFAKINAQAMFNEVDSDGTGTISKAKWLAFWENVVAQPEYAEVSDAPRQAASERAVSEGGGSEGGGGGGGGGVGVGGGGGGSGRVVGAPRGPDLGSARAPLPLRAHCGSPASARFALLLSQEDVLEEIDMIIDGGTWVDFDDGRTT